MRRSTAKLAWSVTRQHINTTLANMEWYMERSHWLLRLLDRLFFGCSFKARWSDVTVSMATIRSSFCGYIMASCVELRGEDLSCYLNNIQSVGLWKCMITWACQQSVFQRYQSEKHLSEFYPQDGDESRLASKLRHCHPMYNKVRSSQQ